MNINCAIKSINDTRYIKAVSSTCDSSYYYYYHHRFISVDIFFLSLTKKKREAANKKTKKMKKFLLIFGIATFAVHAIVSENDDEARIEQSQMEGNEN